MKELGWDKVAKVAIKKSHFHKLKFLHFDPKILSIHFSKNATLKDRKLKEVQRFEVQLRTCLEIMFCHFS